MRCQTVGAQFIDAGAELGYVKYGADGVPEHATLIKRGPCRRLASYVGSDHGRPSLEEVVAVHVLSHEARHMAGTTEEAHAECEAVQRDAWAARELGATREEAMALSVTYWREVYPRMPEAYRSADCRPDGAWDEHLADAPWSAS